MTLKCRLKVILAEKEMLHKDFAHLVGVSKTTATMWISGKAKPDLDRAYEVADLLGVKVTDIWVKED